MHSRSPTSILIAIILAAILTPLAFNQLAAATTATPFSDGQHRVGTDITPGTYVAEFENGICTVSITSSHDSPERNPVFISRAIITITQQDSIVETNNCGEWQPHSIVGKKSLAQTFGEGTYQVGIDIAPGIYTASNNNGRCLWFNIKDFQHHTDPHQTLTWWKVGQPIVKLTKDDIGFYSIRCGTWQIRKNEPAKQPLTEFPDDSYLVNIDIAPGNYIADSGDEDCNWFRTAPFGDSDPDNTGGYLSKGRQIITILPTDTGFFSQGCGTWRPLSDRDLTAEPDDVIDQGTFAVGIDIQPGAYVADAQSGRICRWLHLGGFAGRADDIISSGTGLLRGITKIPTDSAGFRSIGCGQWQLIDNLSQDAVSDTFGDGEHIVNVHIKPGIYTSPGPETGRCSWRRFSGFSGNPEEVLAVRNPVGKNIAEIKETDATFHSFGCGQWTPLETDAANIDMTSFGRGTWAVDAEIGPGTYTADIPTGITCFWGRLSAFNGEPDTYVTTEYAVGHSVMTVHQFDAGFYSDGCGTWNAVSQDDKNRERDLPHVFNDGVYIVHQDIMTGTYITDGIESETCYWSRLTGFDGDVFNRISIYASPGQAIATILDSDVGFRSFGCGTWRRLTDEDGNEGVMPNTKEVSSRFSDGTYRVGIDIRPGTYMTSGGSQATCRWRRLKDFTWNEGVIVEKIVAGLKIVEISEDDLGFASSGCDEWRLVDLETLAVEDNPYTRFSSGSYIVGVHIEPGTYYSVPITNSRCKWQRVSGFGGTPEDTIAKGGSDGRWIVTIKPTDIGFVTYRCGIWRNMDNALMIGPFDTFDDGNHLVNVHISPGTYYANSPVEPFIDGKPIPTCKWKRVSEFGHTQSDIQEEGRGRGTIEVTIAEDDIGFISSGCGTWRKSQ